MFTRVNIRTVPQQQLHNLNYSSDKDVYLRQYADRAAKTDLQLSATQRVIPQ